MTDATTGGNSVLRGADPVVREITVDDITVALAAGMRDFRAAPAFGLFFGGVYAVGGAALFYLVGALDMIFLAYPMAAGFAIVAPFVAVGLYEVSRMLERGETPAWGPVLAAIPNHGGREIAFMALVTVFGLIVWVYAAGFLYAIFFGLSGYTFPDLVGAIISTPKGIAFLMIGNLIGAVIALGLFSISVVSYPMLLDRDVDFVTAMITSVRAVFASPGPMIGWGIFIACLLGLALIPMCLGLFVALPVLGHASWHMYRKAVEP